MTHVLNNAIHKFLSKGLAISKRFDEDNTTLDPWYYLTAVSQLEGALQAVTDIDYIEDLSELSELTLKGKPQSIILYDSGDESMPMPNDPAVNIFKRFCCLLVVKARQAGFESACSLHLGVDVNRHTVETFRGRTSHFLLPFDVALYVEQSMLDQHGADALCTNLFNQDGHLFSPHITPSIVTGLVSSGSLTSVAAFLPQPKMIRQLCFEAKIEIDDAVSNEDLNADVLLALKVLLNRYKLPINPQIFKEVNDFDRQLASDNSEISVKIADTDVTLVKPPKH